MGTSEADQYSFSRESFNKFNPTLLGLGDLRKANKSFEGLAVVFDLQQFTAFCDQRDPHLEVPQYLTAFLNWLFKSIAKESVKRKEGDRLILWSTFPFFAKFTGDGVLFLWDARDLTPEARGMSSHRFISSAMIMKKSSYQKSGRDSPSRPLTYAVELPWDK